VVFCRVMVVLNRVKVVFCRVMVVLNRVKVVFLDS